MLWRAVFKLPVFEVVYNIIRCCGEGACNPFSISNQLLRLPKSEYMHTIAQRVASLLLRAKHLKLLKSQQS